MYTSTYTGEGGINPNGAGFGNYGFIIFFIIILWFFFGMNKEDYCSKDLRVDQVAETARLEYNNLAEQRSAKEQIMAQASAIRNEQMAETMFDLKLNAQTQELKNGQLMIAKDAKIDSLTSELLHQRELFGIKSELAEISCKMLPKPPVYGQGFVTTGTPLPANAGYGFGGGFNCPC